MESIGYFLPVLLCVFVPSTNGAKILSIFPVPAKSHFIYNEAIVKSLIEAGHQVTVVSPFPNLNPSKNYTVIDMSKDSIVYVGRTTISELNDLSTYSLISLVMGIEEEHCYKFMKMKEIQDIFDSKEKLFDLMIVEVFTMHECFLPLAQKLNIPVIGTASQRSWLHADHVIGNPNNPSLVPSEFASSWKMDSFYERLINLWKTLIVCFAEYDIATKLGKFYQEYSQELHFYKEKSIKPSLIFYNTHFSYFPRPMNPNAIEIGGIHIEKEKPLPADIKKFMDESVHGVILFTLGSMIKGSSLSDAAQLAFKEAFAEIPQRVIWKYEEEMENVSDNVLLSRWIPQRDVLAHKNIRAFITHCGQSGVYEALHAGKPLVTLPLYGDQPSVAAVLQNLGVAVSLDIHKITKNSILKALNSVINDTKYQESIERLSKSFTDRPMTPQETVVYWTEYVIRHNGAPHLQSAASNLSWYQYFLLDVILFIIFVFSVIICLVYCVLEICYFYFTYKK